MHSAKRPVILLTLAQLICILAIPLTLFIALVPAFLLYSFISQTPMLQTSTDTMSVLLFSGGQCLRDLAMGICCFCAEMEAIGIFGRMKKASAFSERNSSALGRIAVALAIAGMVALLFGNSLVPFLLQGLPAVSPVVERLLLPFMLLVIALMVRAVQVLMRRALTMQTETDLTV